MPCVGNKCPGMTEFHKFDTGYCLTSCDHQCVPASVLIHIQSKAHTDVHQGQYLSATALLGCLRQLYLERTVDYYVEPPQQWWSMRGSLLHAILENPDFAGRVDDMRRYVEKLWAHADPSQLELLNKTWLEIEAGLLNYAKLLPVQPRIPDWIPETVYKYPLGVINGKERWLYGTIDVLRPEAGVIIDYKTMGDLGLRGIARYGAKKHHKRQFNIYRLLVERGFPADQSYETYTPVQIRKIEAYYMSMMEIIKTGNLHTITTDFQKSDPFRNDNERGREVVATRNDVVLKKGKKRETAHPVHDYELSPKNKWRLTYAIPSVELEPLDEVEKFVQEQSRILIEAFDNGKMPPMVEPEQRQWRCENYCADQIRQACDKYNDSVGESRIVQIDVDPYTLVEG